VKIYQIERLVVGDIQTNCWIVQYGTGNAGDDPSCVLIDPGDQADLIIAQLKKMSLRPAHVLLTHGHFDHIGALAEIRAAYPEAFIAIHRADAKYLKPGLGAQNFEDGDVIGPFTVLSTPGHTPGSVAFLNAGQKILFSGDTLFQGDCGRVDLPGGDQRSIEESLRRLLALDKDIQVLPGHGPATTIAAERGTKFF
jgi:glyoxylase-like metal-dependent hydrolase (beta-lactamase superfamily II)